MLIEAEALWVYRYMKNTGQEVNDDYPSAKITAFKKLCFDEGDYKMKDDKQKNKDRNKKRMNDRGLLKD